MNFNFIVNIVIFWDIQTGSVLIFSSTHILQKKISKQIVILISRFLKEMANVIFQNFENN